MKSLVLFALHVIAMAAGQMAMPTTAYTSQYTLSEQLSWAGTNCAPYSANTAAGAAAMAVSSFFGASDTDYMAPNSRVSALLSVVSSALGGNTGDLATDPNLQNYIQALITSMAMPGIILIVLIVLCWLPIWISRCQPAKCCKPKEEAYEKKEMYVSCGCCSLWWLIVLVLTGVAALTGSGAADGINSSMCGAIGLTNSTRNFYYTLYGTVTSANGILQNALSGVGGIYVSVGTLNNALGPTGGVASSCASATAAIADLTAVDTAIVAVAGAGASIAGDATYVSSMASLTTSQTILCTDLPALGAQVSNLFTTMTPLAEQVDTIGPQFANLIGTLSSVGNQVDGLVLMVVDQVRTGWDLVSGGLAALAGVISIPIFVFLLFALLGGCCLAYANKGGVAVKTQEDRSMCHKCGSCFSCFGWWLFSVIVLVTLIISILLLIISTVMTDVGSIMLMVPRSPNTTIGSLCDSARFAVGSSTLDGCAVLSGCFATPSVDLWSTLSPVIGLSSEGMPGGIDLTALDTSAVSTNSPIDPASFTNAISAANSVPTLTAAGFGITTPTALVNSVDASLSSMATNAAAIPGPISSLGAQASWALGNVTIATAAVGEVTTWFTAFLGTANETFACDWMRDDWDSIVKPAMRGATVTGLGSMAISLQVSACFGFFLVWTLIWTTIRCGGVGRKGGGKVAPYDGAVA